MPRVTGILYSTDFSLRPRLVAEAAFEPLWRLHELRDEAGQPLGSVADALAWSRRTARAIAERKLSDLVILEKVANPDPNVFRFR